MMAFHSKDFFFPRAPHLLGLATAYLVTAATAASSLPLAHAAGDEHLTLQPAQLEHRVAIPLRMRLRGLAHAALSQDRLARFAQNQADLARFAQNQADLECQAHRCGGSSCTRAVSFKTVKAPPHPSATLRESDLSPQKSGLISARKWDFAGFDARFMEEYFETIVCTAEQPTSSDHVGQGATPHAPALLTAHQLTSLVQHFSLAQALTDSRCAADRVVAFSTRETEKFKAPPTAYLNNQLGNVTAYAPYAASKLGIAALFGAMGLRGLLSYCSNPIAGDGVCLGLFKQAFVATDLNAIIGAKLTPWIKRKTSEKLPHWLLSDSARDLFEVKSRLESLEAKLKSETQDKLMPQENKEYAAYHIRLLKAGITRLSDPDSLYARGMPSTIEEIKEKLNRLDALLQLPLTTQRIDATIVRQQMKALTANIDPALANVLTRIASTIAYDSETDQPSKRIYYLKGHPGTGKTFLVKEIAKILGLPVLKTTAADSNGREIKLIEDLDKFLSATSHKNIIVL